MGASRPWATSRIGFNPRRQVVPQPWALVSVVSIVSVWKATPPAAGPWPLDPDERPAAGRMSGVVSLSTHSQTETIETTETKLTEIGTTFVSFSSRRLASAHPLLGGGRSRLQGRINAGTNATRVLAPCRGSRSTKETGRPPATAYTRLLWGHDEHVAEFTRELP